MAARGPAGGRGTSNRFAQFKLVLLGAPRLPCPITGFVLTHVIGESAVGKVNPMLDCKAHDGPTDAVL